MIVRPSGAKPSRNSGPSARENNAVSESTTVIIEALPAYGVSALVTTGMSESNARTVADKLVLTDSWGTFTDVYYLIGV